MECTISKSLYKRAIKFFVFAICITILVTVVTYIINPDLKEMTTMVEKRLSDDIVKSIGIKKVWSFIAYNGVKVPLQMILLSLIPIQFLYFANTILTASLPGILFGIMLRENFKIGIGIILSATSYFVFEIFAFCLLSSILFELNQTVRIKIGNLYKKDKTKVFLVKKIIETVKVYAILFLPMIIFSALLETYVADIICNLFK